MPTPTRYRSGLPTNWQEADAYLGSKADRPIANNTRLQRRAATDSGPGSIAVRLHATDVVTYAPDGSVTLDSGGWRTPTTRDRIDAFALAPIGGLALWQVKGRWLLYRMTGRGGGDRPLWELAASFFDGMRLSAEGEILNPEPVDATVAREARIAQTLKDIRAYVRAYMAEFRKGMPAPSGGDCWLCLMRDVQTGQPWGDAAHDTEHLTSHIEERYFVPSLAYNAVAERGYRFPEIILGASQDGKQIGGTRATTWSAAEPNGMPDSVSRALTRYLKRRLLPEVAA